VSYLVSVAGAGAGAGAAGAAVVSDDTEVVADAAIFACSAVVADGAACSGAFLEQVKPVVNTNANAAEANTNLFIFYILSQ
jgi:hypothetical protein